jgi:zinc finger MIZ domain-containing protein
MGDSQASATMTEFPPLPSSVLLPSDQENRVQHREVQWPSLQEQPASHQQVQSPARLSSPAAVGSSLSNDRAHQGLQAQWGQINRHWQGARGQLPSPTQTSTSSPRTNSDLPLPHTNFANQTQSHPSPTTSYASGPHKRQRTQVAVMPSLKPRVAMIEAHIESVGGRMNLNAGLEKPRFQLLIEACNSEDAFYVALHQVFCVWDFDQTEIANIRGFPDPTVIRSAFKVLGQLIRDNEQLAPNHKKWFAGFPSPLSHLMNNSEPYRLVMADVGIFLGKLAAEWIPLSMECSKRRYPPLVDELVNRMGLLSPILQGVVFTATRRTMGISDGEIGTKAESLFRRDQRNFQLLAAQNNLNGPPTAKGVNELNAHLVNEYIALHNQFFQQRHASGPAYSSPLGQTSTPTPVVPSNGHTQQGAQSTAPSPWQPNPQHQASWNQNLPSPRPAGSWQLSNQQAQIMGTTTAGSTHSSLTAGRPSSGEANRVYTNTPSPTLLQSLSMESPVQQGFQFQPTPRSNNVQMHVSQNGPAYARPNGTFSQSGPQHVDPSTQHRNQIMIQQQQQQQQVAAQYQGQGQHSLASSQQPFASQQGQWQQNPQQQAVIQQVQQVQQVQQQQIQQQQHLLSQQVLNMNRTAQLRQSGSGALDLQHRAHGRNNSGSNTGRRTPGVNPMPGPSPQPNPASVPGPRRPQSVFIDQIQNAIQTYSQTHPLQRPLVPPVGYVHPQQAVNPEMTALHQAHIRSPLLIPIHTPPATMNKEDPALRYYQAVRGFALDPTKIPTNTPLSKFEFRVAEADFQLIPRDGPPSSSQLATRQFRRGTLQLRLRCVQMKKSQAICSTPDWVVTDTVWPESACLEINKNHLEIRRKNHHGKDLPIDITAFVRNAGPNSTNRITLSITRGRAKMKEFTYFLAVEIVEILQHGQILDMCRQHRIPASQTLDKIKKSLASSQNDDDEIAMVSSDISVDLSDPFTARIFETPVRGSNCLHRECFDLETFLITRNSKPKRPQQPCMIDVWKCPLCGKDARPYSLLIDDFLAAVRARLAEEDNLDVKAIWIDADGNWRPKEIPRSSVKRSHPDDSEDSSDDESARKQRALSAANQTKSIKRVVEVIDLDDD